MNLGERIRALPLPSFTVEPVVQGSVVRMTGLTLEAEGVSLATGASCLIENQSGELQQAEVVGFNHKTSFLMLLGHAAGVHPGARVIPLKKSPVIRAGSCLLGRILDANGQPLDNHPLLSGCEEYAIHRPAINPLLRKPITEPLDVGVRAINAMLTIGIGQRIGLFAGSGVGKSVLLGMMARYTSADVVVVGLIGERGREVREFIEHILGDEGRRRAVVVASPADESPLMRIHAAWQATTIAEYFRDQGKNVLLLMDSLTRFAQAQREIGLAIGEPPATKGYTPSVFAKLPQLVERAGNGAEGGGSITGIYTVLTEGDDQQDPVADAARAILDGHIVLSRELAEEGHYPAIDISASISRAMTGIVSERHLKAAQRLKFLYGRYRQNQDLINVGAYVAGSDPDTDEAILKMPVLREYLLQGLQEKCDLHTSIDLLCQLIEAPVPAAMAEPQPDTASPNTGSPMAAVTDPPRLPG